MTDFGFATYFNQQEKLDTVLGSPLYMAPEILHHKKYDSKVDIWSAGVITHILLLGRQPYGGATKEEIYESIKEDPLDTSCEEWNNISGLAKDFIE